MEQSTTVEHSRQGLCPPIPCRANTEHPKTKREKLRSCRAIKEQPKDLTCKPRLESGLDCLMCAIFAQRGSRRDRATQTHPCQRLHGYLAHILNERGTSVREGERRTLISSPTPCRARVRSQTTRLFGTAMTPSMVVGGMGESTLLALGLPTYHSD